MSRHHLCSSYISTLSCIICISVTTQKVCRDRGLLPLSLTSFCSLVLMLRHGVLVFFKYLLSQPRFHVVTRLLCVQLTRFVTTQFVMSRQDFFAFVWKPLSQPKKPIATEFFRHLACFLVRLHFLCCDLDFCVRDVLHVATLNMLCRDDTFLHVEYFHVVTLFF